MEKSEKNVFGMSNYTIEEMKLMYERLSLSDSEGGIGNNAMDGGFSHSDIRKFISNNTSYEIDVVLDGTKDIYCFITTPVLLRDDIGEELYEHGDMEEKCFYFHIGRSFETMEHLPNIETCTDEYICRIMPIPLSETPKVLMDAISLYQEEINEG